MATILASRVRSTQPPCLPAAPRVMAPLLRSVNVDERPLDVLGDLAYR
ncbi:hypothetical protein [Actinopolymorpha pittospori]